VLILVVVVAVLGLFGAGTAAALLWYGERNLTRTEVDVDQAGATVPQGATPNEGDGGGVDQLSRRMNILVVGSDSREGLSDEELQALGTERTSEDGGLLTDTIVLLQLDPVTDRVVGLSFPRDLRVTRCDGSRGKINKAYRLGERIGAAGPDCLVDTVRDFSGAPIHHFVQVDLAGFKDVVDTLGGVSFYLRQPLEDRFAGLDLPQGCVTLSPTEALGFVRARHLDSDFGRIARQQRFAKEVLRDATAAGTLVNVPRLFSLLDSVASAVQTDQELSFTEMREVAFSLRDLSAEDLTLYTVPGQPDTINEQAVVVPDRAEAERLFEAFAEGRLLPGDASAPPLTQTGQLRSAPASPSPSASASAGSSPTPGASVADGETSDPAVNESETTLDAPSADESSARPTPNPRSSFAGAKTAPQQC
jgi:LCP family protein required for cell wall assembly